MTMMKRETLRDRRRYVFKMDYHGPDANTYAQVLDSHLEALDKIDSLREELKMAYTAMTEKEEE